jgi:hypothetical protein
MEQERKSHGRPRTMGVTDAEIIEACKKLCITAASKQLGVTRLTIRRVLKANGATALQGKPGRRPG